MMYMHGAHLVPRCAAARRRRRRAAALGVLILAAAAACRGAAPSRSADTDMPHTTTDLDARIRRFAPVPIAADLSGLPAGERQTLAHLVSAARVMDGLFLDQVWAGNTAELLRLAADRTDAGRAALHYFVINKGPWSRLDHDELFLPADGTIPPKPPQANFYPADATREDVERWLGTLTPAARADATGFFTRIERDRRGEFTAVPYSVAYRDRLSAAAHELREAAAATSQPSLKHYLALRADAFLSNDYYPSDLAWMELDASIDPTIGPYETYEDEWFGYKAAFEAFITIRDDAETAKLAAFGRELQGLEDALPIEPRYRNPALGALAPIRVVNVVFTAGDANRGVQTAAFNLPNDDRVIREKGAKRVMLKNVQDAKFEKVLVPIAGVALSAADRPRVAFDAFFTHILMHELMHGLGPHVVTPSGQPVRLALKDTYSAIEEAKADVSGLWALQRLVDAGRIPPVVGQSMYITFLASAFRSIRFGLNEAHGKGVALQLNYLLDHGAVAVHDDGTFAIVDPKIKDAVSGLTHDLMTLEATGDYTGAQALLAKLGVVRPEVQRVLDRLRDVPVDIEPEYVTASQLKTQ
jgi:hypothetical protein